jgi:putative ABC transport system permease protein
VTFLVALEIALACAVLCNACFLIASRIRIMHMVSGIDEKSLAFISLNGYDASRAGELNARVVSGLSSIPGVKTVGIINDLPFAGPSNDGVTTDPSGLHGEYLVSVYAGDTASLRALGLHLVAGRAPGSDDYQPIDTYYPDDSLVLISRSLADHLWQGRDAIGKELWSGKFHYRVVGVVEHLSTGWPEMQPAAGRDWSLFIPVLPGAKLSGTYVVQADPSELPRVFRDVVAAMPKIAPDAVLDYQGSGMVSDLRDRYFDGDRAMIKIMLGVILALMLVTALGIVGLASFWVQQRRKQIGIRRAIGATRGDILRYFHTENFLIVTMGIVMGIVLAYALNLIMMRVYEVTLLPLAYLGIGALVLWLLGQLAVLGPALRAAAVPPVVATRSV